MIKDIEWYENNIKNMRLNLVNYNEQLLRLQETRNALKYAIEELDYQITMAKLEKKTKFDSYKYLKNRKVKL